jgi:hypothetical protein
MTPETKRAQGFALTPATPRATSQAVSAVLQREIAYSKTAIITANPGKAMSPSEQIIITNKFYTTIIKQNLAQLH